MSLPAPLVVAGVRLAEGAAAIALEVAEHQTVVLLGDGRSGVARLGGFALGLERPSSGRVQVLGTVIADLPEDARLAFRRRVGYLPAGDGLVHNLSLRDNIALPLRFGSPASAREIDGRVSVMLAAVRLVGVAALRPAQASEEERRRAALARALAFDPSLLVLEQPFDGLTPRVAGELLELARGGETAEGARRALLITAPDLTPALHRRVERVYRLTRTGALAVEPT